MHVSRLVCFNKDELWPKNEIILCDKIYSKYIMTFGFKHSGKDKTIESFVYV